MSILCSSKTSDRAQIQKDLSVLSDRCVRGLYENMKSERFGIYEMFKNPIAAQMLRSEYNRRDL